MFNRYDELQKHTFVEALKLASAGEEFSHLVKIMSPESALRLKIFVQQLPEEIQVKTIYGRAHAKVQAKPSKKARNK
jgi:glycine cleavage system regulatory protein